MRFLHTHRSEGRPQVCELSFQVRAALWVTRAGGQCVKSSGFARCHSEMNATQEGAPYRSSPSAELKLVLRLLSLEAAPGEPAERSGSAPNGESGSSIRISSRRCSSLSVELKKSVKWDSGSEKVVQESAPAT